MGVLWSGGSGLRHSCWTEWRAVRWHGEAVPLFASNKLEFVLKWIESTRIDFLIHLRMRKSNCKCNMKSHTVFSSQIQIRRYLSITHALSQKQCPTVVTIYSLSRTIRLVPSAFHHSTITIHRLTTEMLNWNSKLLQLLPHQRCLRWWCCQLIHHWTKYPGAKIWIGSGSTQHPLIIWSNNLT